jgi:capsule polysaccharide export protein KpsE/RkpR
MDDNRDYFYSFNPDFFLVNGALIKKSAVVAVQDDVGTTTIRIMLESGHTVDVHCSTEHMRAFYANKILDFFGSLGESSDNETGEGE